MSKIYISQAGFQPQDLVRRRLPERDRSFQADREPRRRDFVSLPLAEKEAPPEVPPLAVIPENEIVALPEAVEETPVEAGEDESHNDDATRLSPEEVEQLVSDAYQRGRRAGQIEGREQVKNDFDAAITVVLNIGQELDSLRQTILENSQGELQALAIAIAEKVTRRSVKEQSETIGRTVEEAIRLAISSEEITVLVNPADYQAVLEKSDEVKTAVTGLRAITVRTDESIERGGCRLESDNCIVDATIAGQLADIALRLQSGS